VAGDKLPLAYGNFTNNHGNVQYVFNTSVNVVSCLVSRVSPCASISGALDRVFTPLNIRIRYLNVLFLVLYS
jgi:hypothetical protein